ncbi:hypothetical protein [Salinicoccus sp. HZC-1]|uniref:hypothetical protein n=1 Tax=Salinicoccus sp. HZC-1 TaxID=3385497 RepID=UPI00398B4FF0
MTEQERREEVQKAIDTLNGEIEEINTLLADDGLKESKRDKLEKKLEKKQGFLHNQKMYLDDPEHFDKIQQEYVENSMFTKMGDKMESAGNNMQATGDSMQNAGSDMMKQGCLITLWVFAFPIMIPIWIIKKAFFDKKK